MAKKTVDIRPDKILPDVGMPGKNTNKKSAVRTKLTEGAPDKEFLVSFSFHGGDYEMTMQQRLFCMEYVRCAGAGNEAAILAGYSKNSAWAQARILLEKPDIKRYIKELQNDLSFKIGISAEDIAKEYAKVGFSNIKQLFDENGRMMTVDELTDEAGATVSEYQVIDTKYGEKRVLKRFDKLKALQNLSRMMGCEGEVKVKVDNTFDNVVPKEKLKDIESQLKSLL